MDLELALLSRKSVGPERPRRSIVATTINHGHSGCFRKLDVLCARDFAVRCSALNVLNRPDTSLITLHLIRPPHIRHLVRVRPNTSSHTNTLRTARKRISPYNRMKSRSCVEVRTGRTKWRRDRAVSDRLAGRSESVSSHIY